ncbi:MAG: hypothetical protein JXB03_13090 [Spirochaetales bacterium]|nr:hypothetical protein [Spirochaetales bacterium]
MHHHPETLEKALLTLEDSAFFSIVKNYLGKIETPFHKPSLIQRLCKFLMQPATKERILSLLDHRDRVILSAVFQFHFPTVDSLLDHLSGDFSYFELHSAVLNLEERLLIFEYEDRLYINPILINELSQKVLGICWNIRSTPFSPKELNAPWLSEHRFFALLGILYHRGSVFGKDQSLKKKIMEECIVILFPGSRDETDMALYEARINQMCRGLAALHFFQAAGPHVRVKMSRIRDFGRLSSHDRLLYIWAACINVIISDEHVYPVARIADTLSSFLISLPLHKGFDRKSLNYILGMVSPDLEHRFRNLIIDALLELHVLVQEDGIIGLSPYLQISPDKHEEQLNGSIRFTEGVSFTLDTRYPFGALLLSVFSAECRSVDYIAQFEITRASIHRGAQFFDTPLIDIYESFSAGISQGAGFTIRQWAEQLDDILLYSGITIKVKPKVQHIFESVLEGLPHEKISGDIYVVPLDALSSLQALLEHHGILVPGIREPKTSPSLLTSRLTTLKKLAYQPIELHLADHDRNDTKPEFMDSLYEQLAKQKLSRSERDEIDGKIKSGMILFPDQISAEICRKDKSEARGVDFQGKINLIQQALKNGTDLLSLEMYDESYEVQSYLVVPLRLKKDTNNHVLEARILPGEGIHIFPVHQLAKVKRMRKSLYAS